MLPQKHRCRIHAAPRVLRLIVIPAALACCCRTVAIATAPVPMAAREPSSDNPFR
jgi:hypothetical protein